jgi:transposase
MAGRCEGVSDGEWRLFEDVFPPAPLKCGRGMPHAPFRQILNTLLYVLITGCRWCDVPRGPTMGLEECHAALVAALADGWHAGCDQARILGVAEEGGMIRWAYGAVDGAFSPWQGWGRGCRPRGERQRYADPQPHRGKRHALGESDHTGQRGRAGAGAPIT